MFLKRDFIIKKQLTRNRQCLLTERVSPATMNQLEIRASEQLSMSKIKSREMEYNRIQLYLCIANDQDRNKFYYKIEQGLQDIFHDEKAKKTIEDKWSHSLKSNVLGLFHHITRDFFNAEAQTRHIFANLYTDCIIKLCKEDSISRVEEKFLDCFLVEAIHFSYKLDVLGSQNCADISVAVQEMRNRILNRQSPKPLTNAHFLQMQLPHQKFIYNQLLHSINPKFLLPFQKKGTFALIGNEMLSKLNKADMQTFLYWSYFQYQQSQLYKKVRRAAIWQTKIDIMLSVIKTKISIGLQKNMNLINEKIKSLSRQIDDNQINQIISYVQICLQICRKKNHEQHSFSTALQKIDLGQAFQQKYLQLGPKLKDVMLKIVQLYLQLLIFCEKKKLKLKFIQQIVVIICKLIKQYNQQKFSNDISGLVKKLSKCLKQDEQIQLFYIGIEYVKQQWKRQQDFNEEVVKINQYVVGFFADFAEEFGFEDYGRTDYKAHKLQFFFIMALNCQQRSYFESKKKFTPLSIDISHSLANNLILNTLKVQKKFYQPFRQHLKLVFGDYSFNRHEYEGLLAILDEVITFRIQVAKNEKYINSSQSFYAMLVSILEKVQRTDNSGKLLSHVKKYFEKCTKAYMISTNHSKFQDSGKHISSRLLNTDVSYLAEGTVAANPLISKFCHSILLQYIENYPELAFHQKILIVISECISLLYHKSTQQYQSRAEKIKGKYFVSNILIPTRSKIMIQRLIILMQALYHIILRGHCIDVNYLRIRVLYLVKQNSKTANISFGWKFLKHIMTNFKEDNSFVRKQVLLNNSCAWFVNEEFFTRKLRQMKPQKILLDQCLLALHYNRCDGSDLKKIIQSVEPQIQIEFLIVTNEQTDREVENIIDDLSCACSIIEELELQIQPDCDAIEQEQNRLYDIVSRIKTIHIKESTAVHILGKFLEICQKFNNYQLFKYIFLKVVPFFYCITDVSKKILTTASHSLFFTVQEFNTISKLYLEKAKAPDAQQTFNIKVNYFGSSIEQYQQSENSASLHQYWQKMKMEQPITKRYMFMKLHERRLHCIRKMYKYIVQFFSEHLHVFVAKGIPLMELTQIFKISFGIDVKLLEFINLESICYSLTSHLSLVNLMKSSIEKGETQYDEVYVDEFYYQTLRMGLFHFQKNKTFYDEELLLRSSENSNLKSLQIKINFFIQICDYLRNDDFHRFRKKKLPKKQSMLDKKKEMNPLAAVLDYYRKHNNSINHDEIGSCNPKEQPQENRVKPKANNQAEILDMTVLRYSLLYLISQQIDRIKAYLFVQLNEIKNPYSLSGKKKFLDHSRILKLFDYLGQQSTVLIFNFLHIFRHRIDHPQTIEQRIKQQITLNPDYSFPEFLRLFVQHNLNNINTLKQINYWKPPNIQTLFGYLSQDYQSYPYLQLYTTKVLSRLHSQQILFYLPQIYQTLALKSASIVYNFLLEYARKSASFAHQLIWISKVESKLEPDPHNKNPRLPGVHEKLMKLAQVSTLLTQDVIRQFTKQEKSFFKEVDEFYEEITAVSGKLNPKWTFAEKRQRIQSQLQKICVPRSVYLPTNPFYQVKGLKIQSGTPMQSAAKCPFLLTFICMKYVGPDKDFEHRKIEKHRNNIVEQFEIQPIHEQNQNPKHLPTIQIPSIGSVYGRRSRENNQKQQMSLDPKNASQKSIDLNDVKVTVEEFQNPSLSKAIKTQEQSTETQVSCIFKVFDDIRQDSLALQVIQLFMQIFEKHNLGLKLFPYKTISNRTGHNLDIGGIIEVVPKTVSRDSIGKTHEQSLYEFFLNNFGAEYHNTFQQARQNFIKSQAAYSIISYILQIKDRHNGNILINKQQGYLVHIDFGFIFDISPANNLRFERADFKLTEQMIMIMGGKVDSQPFQLYMNLVIKGFLISRKYHQHIMNIVKLMFNSGLPCFLQESLVHLQDRFVLQMSEIEAANYMKKIIEKAADNWTTNWYDKIQWIQQRIYH